MKYKDIIDNLIFYILLRLYLLIINNLEILTGIIINIEKNVSIMIVLNFDTFLISRDFVYNITTTITI